MSEATHALIAAQDGDPAAFERFVRLTIDDVTPYCRYLGDRDHLDDLVQDTYLRALRSLHTYRGDSDALRWLLTIARRACADAIEHHQRSRRPELTRRPTHDNTTGIDIELLLDDLPDDQRHAFVLTQLLGYRYDEVAQICDCPVGTIRSRVARARTQLAATVTASEASA
jgi:RNA polymerase sigma-70 factor (ECF subfamily)